MHIFFIEVRFINNFQVIQSFRGFKIIYFLFIFFYEFNVFDFLTALKIVSLDCIHK